MMTASFLEKPPGRSEVEHWEWEPGTTPWPAWNRPLAQLLGQQAPEPKAPLAWLDWVAEDDRARVRSSTEAWVAADGNPPLLLVFRAPQSNGSLLHVVVQGTITERNGDGTARRILGAFVNTTRQFEAKQELKAAHERLGLVIAGISAGVWELNLETQLARCSPRFYELLGYSSAERLVAQETFLNELLHPDDQQMVNEAMDHHLRFNTPYRLDVRIRTRPGAYRWFEVSGQCHRNELGSPISIVGSIIDIDLKKNAQLELEKREFMLNESGAMARIGGWEMDLTTGRLWWSEEVRRIHEVEPHFEPVLEEAILFYVEEFRPAVRQMVAECITEKRPWDRELQILTARQRKIWIRTIGKPTLNEQGEVVSFRGVFQDIDRQKKREISLQKSLNLIRDQNQRLFSFAHIISHNLRSHTGNLELMIELMNETTEEAERSELLHQLRAISGNLNQTIAHLNEVVTIRTNRNQEKKRIRFADALAQTLATLAPEWPDLPEAVRADFTEAEEIDYVPAYLSSILSNLLTNASRYRHPARPLEVLLRTRRERGQLVLDVRDNGLGIDLQQCGGKLFGLYHTFHAHPQARGFGLFLTRNYVEALGGRIEATSTPGEGTIFTLTF